MRPGVRRATLGGKYIYAQWLDSYLDDQGYSSTRHIYGVDETSGTTAEDIAGSLDGSYVGSPTLGDTAIVDDDGVGVGMDQVDDDITVPDDSSINLGSSQSFTIAKWVYLPSSFFTNSEKNLWGKENGSSGTGAPRYLVSLRGTDGSVKAFLDGDGGSGDSSTTSGVMSAGTAHLVGLRVDRSADELVAFVDKTRSQAVDVSAVGSVTPSADLHWGERGDGSDYQPGRLDAPWIILDAVSNSDLDKIYDVGIDRSNR